MRILGIIPARAGSKRLPNKNVRNLGGRPLIAHTCSAALECRALAAVYVNTDSPEIARVASDWGVPCPLLRPAALASDNATTRDANRFMLEELRKRGDCFDAVVVLQPTSPLRTADDIREAVALFIENAPCAVVSACRVGPASWLGRIGRDGRFDPLAGDEPVFRLNGAVYAYRTEDYMHDRQPARTLVYAMPPARSVDIDTPEDFEHAEQLLRSSPVCAAG